MGWIAAFEVRLLIVQIRAISTRNGNFVRKCRFFFIYAAAAGRLRRLSVNIFPKKQIFCRKAIAKLYGKCYDKGSKSGICRLPQVKWIFGKPVERQGRKVKCLNGFSAWSADCILFLGERSRFFLYIIGEICRNLRFLPGAYRPTFLPSPLLFYLPFRREATS